MMMSSVDNITKGVSRYLSNCTGPDKYLLIIDAGTMIRAHSRSSEE